MHGKKRKVSKTGNPDRRRRRRSPCPQQPFRRHHRGTSTGRQVWSSSAILALFQFRFNVVQFAAKQSDIWDQKKQLRITRVRVHASQKWFLTLRENIQGQLRQWPYLSAQRSTQGWRKMESVTLTPSSSNSHPPAVSEVGVSEVQPLPKDQENFAVPTEPT